MARERTCAEWRRGFEAAGDAAANAEESHAFDDHAAWCADCRNWLGVLAGELKTVTASPPAGFVDAVLARTTGAACERAVDRLPPFVDGQLGAVDQRLVAEHTAHCAKCLALVRALTRFSVELPTLAEVRPRPSLVPEVLALTSRAVRDRVAAPALRIFTVWQRLLLRPQLALEGAYIGALVFSAVFAISGGSARDLERQLAGLAVTRARVLTGLERDARTDPAPWSALEQAVSQRSASFVRAAERVGDAFERIWTSETSPVKAAPDRSKTTLNEGDD